MSGHELTVPTDEALHYGRHTVYRDEAVPVVRLLERAIVEGRPIRLEWPGWDASLGAADEPAASTAVLPKISVDYPTDDSTNASEATEPTTATRDARKLLWPERFSWFPQALAG